MQTNCRGASFLCYPCTTSVTLQGIRFWEKVCLPRRLVVFGRSKSVYGTGAVENVDVAGDFWKAQHPSVMYVMWRVLAKACGKSLRTFHV